MIRTAVKFIVCSGCILASMVLLAGCYSEIKERERDQRSYPPSVSQILRLTPVGTDLVVIGIEEGKRLSWIEQRLEWQGFQILSSDEINGMIVAQQRFRKERMTLQMKLLVSDSEIKTTIIWRGPLIIPHPMSPARTEIEWNAAYRAEDTFSKSSAAFALGVHHLLHIPHQSLSFDTIN